MTTGCKSSAIAQHGSDARTIGVALRVLRILAAANQELVRASNGSEFLEAVCEIALQEVG